MEEEKEVKEQEEEEEEEALEGLRFELRENGKIAPPLSGNVNGGRWWGVVIGARCRRSLFTARETGTRFC